MKRKVLRKQQISNKCFVCGINNPYGVMTEFFEVEGDELVGIATFKDEHQSYPGRCHGGVVAAVLDETIGRAINIDEPEAFGVTIDLQITYRKPVPLNEEVKIIARIIEKNKRTFVGTGEVISKDGTVLASSKGTYAYMPLNKVVEGVETSEVMFDNLKDSDPTEIDY